MRLTERQDNHIFYVKDGEAYPYTLLSGYDISRVLEKLADLEDKAEPMEPLVVTIRNVNYIHCPKCKRTLWGKEYFCATCGQAVKRSD